MYIIYMIGDEDGYDDDDDGDDVMIILPSPLLGKLGTLNVKYMHDFLLKGYMCSDILFRLAILVSCDLYLMLYMVCLGCPLVQGQPCRLRTSLCIV